MIVTRLERTVCCVPFLPGILPTGKYDEATPAYPEPLSARRQDVLRIHTDAGPVGLGMSGPYFGDRDETPPDLIGKDIRTFEPRHLGGGGSPTTLGASPPLRKALAARDESPATRKNKPLA